MEEEMKKLISENIALNKENNEMLKKLITFQKWNQIYKIVYWAIIILSAIGALYFIKPMLDNLVSVYTGGVGTTSVDSLNDLKNLGTNKDIQEMLNSLNN
ncbi:hypothetical protein A2467_02130 [Candidatus Nomurabacteria bacterium RIFOXYC2_FULL_36_8]|nr:MAG: hypothetical protein UR97_C0004G0159 [Candidatus Nomurabacteria bacterium GW2011_GWE2_36_115]KKP94291.1 MAG: hypothetical protein US00_C0003G0215 [Candidatus Nomurabacteria bacterium GW2011_GWF2_36_126]KKP96582.1 MAG: hypothetical protein US04_C0001G0084 [Candidatus Nomurabacteria bacterium GW2011_GWD2_36_14]KKP99814.1 MAG: hypothetical protein US08_C0001G0497 [Candidatus Nomurabacteria bacterium GW2011_GWF2_36_19]KKQ09281.1 MAG: hypothetical protein US21_C0006G0057 [Candidatus Nomuraba